MNKCLEHSYRLSPWWLKSILISIYALKERSHRRGEGYELRYKQIKDLPNRDIEEIKAYQREKLLNLCKEAYQYSPYYRAKFDSIEVNQEDINKQDIWEIFEKLPLLEKSNLMNNIRDIVSTNPDRPTSGVTYTSGTTGMPLSIEYDDESRQITFSEWRRYFDWLKLPESFRSVRFSGRIIIEPNRRKPPFWVQNYVDDQLFMSAYHLEENNMQYYIDKMNRFKPEFIDGYPSAIVTVANYILSKNIKLTFSPIAISTTAETLLIHQRELIEKAFHSKVYNQYASSEGAPWIVECNEGNYHFWIDTGVFEFINAETTDQNTEIAELVVTSFRSLKTPLLRYRIGDYIECYTDQPVCPCGSSYPIIKEIVGRQDDILYSREKGSVGRLDPAYKGLYGIKKSKIIQVSLDETRVLVVPDKTYDESVQSQLVQNLHDRLGQEMDISVDLVEDIPLGENGKFKSVERLFSVDVEE